MKPAEDSDTTIRFAIAAITSPHQSRYSGHIEPVLLGQGNQDCHSKQEPSRSELETKRFRCWLIAHVYTYLLIVYLVVFWIGRGFV